MRSCVSYGCRTMHEAWQTKSTMIHYHEKLPVLAAPPSEEKLVQGYLDDPALVPELRASARALAEKLMRSVRDSKAFGPVERLMSAYSLSSTEGRVLMELAEALLRIPDVATRDALIQDKIAHHGWLSHDRESDALVSAVGMALHAADVVLSPDSKAVLSTTMQRLGMPVIRACILTGMRILGRQFVYAETMDVALAKARSDDEASFSFDMLGEAARTEADSERFLHSYEEAIRAAGTARVGMLDPLAGDGVSVKLSALYSRYRTRHWRDVQKVLGSRILHLAKMARDAGVALTIDAEETSRLEISLGLVRELAESPDLKDWNGLGVVVQAYTLSAGALIDALADLAKSTGRRIPVRLVKGAYWDSEIKIAQEKGLDWFPVYTSKNHSDLAYLQHAAALMKNHELFYPQFATHNAATLASIETLAQHLACDDFEVQRLHGMGEAVHEAFRSQCNRRMRVYAPVGSHGDLLAYLVRRLLENAANASFLHKFSDSGTPLTELAIDPYTAEIETHAARIRTGADLFLPERSNSRGWDIDSPAILSEIAKGMPGKGSLPEAPEDAAPGQVDAAFRATSGCQPDWESLGGGARATILDRIADSYEREAETFFNLLACEGGKTIDDAVAEVREAVDFCRYYASHARKLPEGAWARGVVVAISPWNFPMAIFTGQVVAALGAGNAVIAKPAEQTPRIASFAVNLMHEAGVPKEALALLAGSGESVGANLVGCGRADMVVFTGSTETARLICKSIAHSSKPAAPLLAETGGINAMIVDSTALPERVIDDVMMSAFRSAGQRCSALRMLYVQEEIHDALLEGLIGASRLLEVGDPLCFSTEIGPVIDRTAKDEIDSYVGNASAEGRLLWRGEVPVEGNYCAPAIIKVAGIADIPREVFGPVLHVAPYKAGSEKDVVSAINDRGFGLTFGLHTRIRRQQKDIPEMIRAGNVYVNRNQIGAMVGSQPFGGHGLSGTGPKAGGPLYLRAFTASSEPLLPEGSASGLELAGPEGEENSYKISARGNILCIGADTEFRRGAAAKASLAGNTVVESENIPEDLLQYDAVIETSGLGEFHAKIRKRLAEADGSVIPLISNEGCEAWLYREKHCCTDLTASGGNVELLSQIG